jgi:alkanesulfonate monooxygenase SsuD/methylene tetrahydromethanopterin reductase-like flavin-dependent oxidoreductase (luciferase family)
LTEQAVGYHEQMLDVGGGSLHLLPGADPRQLGARLPIYVAETDEEAHRHAEQHLLRLFRIGLEHKLEYLFPPGYLPVAGRRGALTSRRRPFGAYSYEELLRDGYAVAGTPDTVRARPGELREELGSGTLAGLLHVGDMPNDRTVRSTELFAREVLRAATAAAVA